MTEESTNDEGLLHRASMRQAEAVDKATDKRRRRRAVAGLISTFVGALAVEYLRNAALFAALLASAIAIGTGLTTSRPGWPAALIAAGIVGIVVLLVALVRRWRPGAQWLVRLAVIATQVVLLVAES